MIISLILLCDCVNIEKKETMQFSIRGVDEDQKEEEMKKSSLQTQEMETKKIQKENQDQNHSFELTPDNPPQKHIRILPQRRKNKKFKPVSLVKTQPPVPAQKAPIEVTPTKASPNEIAPTHATPIEIAPPQVAPTEKNPSNSFLSHLFQSPKKEEKKGNNIKILDLDETNKDLLTEQLINKPKKSTLILNYSSPVTVKCKNCYTSFLELSNKFACVAKKSVMEGIGLFCQKNNPTCSLFNFEKVKYIKVDSEISFISLIQIKNVSPLEGEIYIFTPSSPCMLCVIIYNNFITNNSNIRIYHFFNTVYEKDLTDVLKSDCFKNNNFYQTSNPYKEYSDIIKYNSLDGVNFVNLNKENCNVAA